MLGTLYAAPGNPGIAEHARLVALDAEDHAAVARFCAEAEIGLVVIGPEAPLVAGLADDLRAGGVAVFGPSAAAARLEGSKGFTKALCAAHAIPTAAFVEVSDRASGQAALDRFGLPVVVKADGLAAGKGVTVAATRVEAEAALDAIFAAPGGRAVIEEFLEGEEASLFVLANGADFVAFGSAQDHKRVGEGDTGPNTGGMGAYSPAPVLTPALEARALAEIVTPTLKAMMAAGTPFSGVLYAGLMLTREGPKLIEYNVRFGDPECQVLMARLESDLLPLLLAVARGAPMPAPRFAEESALTVVYAARGYPGLVETGGAVAGLAAATAAGAVVFHARTRDDGAGLVASGGRVLAVTACARQLADARARAYRAAELIDFPSGFYRRDIGWRELARQAGEA